MYKIVLENALKYNKGVHSSRVNVWRMNTSEYVIVFISLKQYLKTGSLSVDKEQYKNL